MVIYANDLLLMRGELGGRALESHQNGVGLVLDSYSCGTLFHRFHGIFDLAKKNIPLSLAIQ